MKEYDIILGIETHSNPSYIFSVGEDLNPKDLRTWLLQLSPDKMLFLQQVGGLHGHAFLTQYMFISLKELTPLSGNRC